MSLVLIKLCISVRNNLTGSRAQAWGWFGRSLPDLAHFSLVWAVGEVWMYRTYREIPIGVGPKLLTGCHYTSPLSESSELSPVVVDFTFQYQEWLLFFFLRTMFYRNDPKFSDTQNICCNHSKVWTMWLYHRLMSPNDADGMANSVDPDQTAPLGAQAHLSENLGSLRYINKWAVSWEKGT